MPKRQSHQKTLNALGNRYMWLCFWCGIRILPIEASREHVIPKAKGGTDAHDNLRVAHKTCNTERGTRDPSEYLAWRKYAGLHVNETTVTEYAPTFGIALWKLKSK